jgi:hypothetical protein
METSTTEDEETGEEDGYEAYYTTYNATDDCTSVGFGSECHVISNGVVHS